MPHSVSAWLVTTLERVYPRTPATRRSELNIDAARGERVSFQVAIRNEAVRDTKIKLALNAPDAFAVRIRHAGYVPLPHINTETPLHEVEGARFLPGLVPDPLFDGDTIHAGPAETHAFWCNLTVPRDAEPGLQTIVAEVRRDSEKIASLKVLLRVHPLELRPRENFPVVQWFYADSLCDYYKVEPFEDRFWSVVTPYMRNLVEHFQDTIYAPIFTPPLDGVKRPTQLLKVSRSGGNYRFEWSDVRRWVQLARSVGIRNFEWTHFFTQWGVKHAIRIYEKKNGEDRLLWDPETEATSTTYRKFLAQFLPEFQRFLQEEHLLANSFFHVSDEPHGDHIHNYKKARALLKELAPWMRTMDALSDIEFGRQGLTDLPIPSISTTLDYMKEKIPCGTYYCCGPRGRYLNRLMDTPLAKIRMNGWLFYRFQPALFLHWGYNYWYKSQTREMIDPYTVSDGLKWPGWAYGDTFCVYPGEKVPVDSIRWEVFAESMQDFALLQTAGVDPDAALLKQIASFEDFPKSAAWITKARKAVLR
ncbi:MAG TPA: DUF4091 domain-containing protein [Planctomycetota bacterium]|nr:DUF4091 domain-containing protein [Planctomycetota bacterium]